VTTSDGSSIYFIQIGDDGPIKVGFSQNPQRRLITLQSSHYERLHLIGLKEGSRFEEANVQARLERFALGHEWYAAVPEVFAEIDEPVARVFEALDKAVVAREHLQRAIALLRGSDSERGLEELERVLALITGAVDAQKALA
jgi:hypothetical protein